MVPILLHTEVYHLISDGKQSICYRWGIFCGKFVFSVGYEHGRFPNRSIADNNTFNSFSAIHMNLLHFCLNSGNSM